MNNISQDKPNGQPQKKYSCNTNSIAPDDHREGGAWRREGESPPCLFSNNSTESEFLSEPACQNPLQSSEFNKLSGYHKRQAQTLYENVDRLATKVAPSVNHLAFLTLTFQENITDFKEAYRRFRSFNSHFLAPHSDFQEWVNVKEQQVRGAWHYHMVIHVTPDILTGFDFDLYDKWLDGPRTPGSFPTGNSELRRLWHELSEALEKYGFGRIFTLEPIKNVDAIGRYVGKYISKHIGQRNQESKGARLINYSRNWKIKASVNRAWNNENAQLWRKKLKAFAAMHGCNSMYQLNEKLGHRWAYRYQNEIMDMCILEAHMACQESSNIEYESPSLSRLYANYEQSEMEIDLETTKSKSRQKSRDLQRKRIQAQNIIHRAKWIPEGLTEKIKKQVKKGREEHPLRQAKAEKEALVRLCQAKETLEQSNEVPF